MEIASCPTAGVEPRRRFEYWNGLVSKVVRGMHVVPPRLRLNSHPINAVGYSISRRGLGLSLAPV
jgi:hypothetical protein